MSTTWTPPAQPDPEQPNPNPGAWPAPAPGAWPPPPGHEAHPVWYGYGAPPPPRRRVPTWGVVLIAVGAFIAGAIAGAVILGVIGFAMSDDAAPVTTAGAGGDVPAFDGELGQCFHGATSFGMQSSVDSIGAMVPCAGSHDLEVFAVTTAPLGEGAALYGSDLSWFADSACLLAFRPYVGATYESSALDYMPVVPSADAWASGDRAVRCVLFDMEGDALVGSAKGRGW